MRFNYLFRPGWHDELDGWDVDRAIGVGAAMLTGRLDPTFLSLALSVSLSLSVLIVQAHCVSLDSVMARGMV